MHLIVGLGNPGKEYRLTRHNIGFMVVDELIHRLAPSLLRKTSFKGELYRYEEILFLKPLTYMNRSGESVAAVKNFYKIPTENVIVIHDDLDLALGALRYKRGGSSGGHNGLRSIDSAIGREYVRVRFGIGRPASKEDVIGYVLSDFTPSELACIRPTIQKAAEAAVALTQEDLDRVRNRYSQKALNCD